MALALTIRGINVLPYLHLTSTNPTIDWTLNERAVFHCSLIGTFRPMPLDEVLVTIDGIRVFGGTVETVSETDIGDHRTSSVEVDAVDFNELADRIFIEEPTEPGWTLRDATARLASQLGNLGVTLGTMDPGPILEPLAWPRVSVTQAFEQLSVVTGWTKRIDAYRKATMALMGTRPAPFPLTSANATINAIGWTRTKERYRNQQLVYVGSPGISEHVATIYGDGSTRLYPTGYLVTEKPQTLEQTIGGLMSVQPIGVWAVDPEGSYRWYWRASDHALIQDFLDPVLAATDYIRVSVKASFPQMVVASNQPEIDDRGLVQDIVALPDEYDARTGLAYAEGLLRRYGAMPQTVSVTTHRPGLEPGMTVQITVPVRGLDASYLITGLHLSHDGKKANGEDYWRFEIEGIEGDEFRGSWLDYFKPLKDTGATNTATIGTGTPLPPAPSGGVTAGGPVYAGGGRTVSVSGTTAWTPIAEFVDVLLASPVIWTCRCHAWLNAAGGTIQVRVVALVSGGIQVGIGIAKAATDWSDPAAFHEFDITLQATAQYYRVEAQVSMATNEGYVAGCVLYPKG